MNVTRRELIQTALTAGMATVLPVGALAGQHANVQEWSRLPEHVPMHPDLSMTRVSFEQQLDQLFLVIRPNQRPFGIRLVTVRDGAAAIAAGTVGSQSIFSAVFIGPPHEWLDEGTYLVESPSYGPMTLFLKPGRAMDGVSWYEVAFNRLPSEFTIDHTMTRRGAGL